MSNILTWQLCEVCLERIDEAYYPYFCEKHCHLSKAIKAETLRKLHKVKCNECKKIYDDVDFSFHGYYV